MTIEEALGILNYTYNVYGNLEIIDLTYVEKRGWLIDRNKTLLVVSTEKMDGTTELSLAFMVEPEIKPQLTLIDGGDDER